MHKIHFFILSLLLFTIFSRGAGNSLRCITRSQQFFPATRVKILSFFLSHTLSLIFFSGFCNDCVARFFDDFVNVTPSCHGPWPGKQYKRYWGRWRCGDALDPWIFVDLFCHFKALKINTSTSSLCTCIVF